MHNHNSYECKREPLWNAGPELCATQVPNQSFFYIEEHIDQKAQRERASTAIITVIDGELTAKQIELEFKNILSGEHTWRWSAKQISENKYVMRFPTAKLVQDFNKFNLGIKNVNTQIMVEPWSSSVGAKGRLQQAWFKVSGIPVDQRGIRTIAKIGGLVGKTVEIDEGTRYNAEYVRIKIACRDVLEVPQVAEGNLGLNIFDFHYERETMDREKGDKHKEGVRISDYGSRPSPKKQKTSHATPEVKTNKGFGVGHRKSNAGINK
jgi:hypothetical protein